MKINVSQIYLPVRRSVVSLHEVTYVTYETGCYLSLLYGGPPSLLVNPPLYVVFQPEPPWPNYSQLQTIILCSSIIAHTACSSYTYYMPERDTVYIRKCMMADAKRSVVENCIAKRDA
jgi:hypothetical protein